MKKIGTISLILIGMFFLAGCGQFSNQNQKSLPETVQQPEHKIPATETPKVGPKDVAANYANLTLMTFPADMQAKKYLAPELQSKFDALGFVPNSYGIQNTPDSISVGEANVSGNKATIKVTGQFGQSQVIWEFTLAQFNDEWKISKISKVSK